jgi:hypothetical protein
MIVLLKLVVINLFENLIIDEINLVIVIEELVDLGVLVENLVLVLIQKEDSVLEIVHDRLDLIRALLVLENRLEVLFDFSKLLSIKLLYLVVDQSKAK